MGLFRNAAIGTFAVVASVGLAFAAGFDYPQTPARIVTSTYFGTTVPDPYRWLEDSKAASVRAWAGAQTQFALTFLRSQPSYSTLSARIRELSNTSAARFGLRIAGGRYFYFRFTPPQDHAVLVFRDTLDGPEHVLFDPQANRENGVAPGVESTYVAPDGSKVAFTTQIGGSENETLHVIDVATATMLSDTITRVGGGTSPTALAWDADAKGFLHTRFPQRADGTYAPSGILIYHHIIGTDPESDAYVFGKDRSPRAEYHLASALSGDVQAISVADGDGVHSSVYLRSGDGEFKQIATPADKIGDSSDFGGAFVGKSLYLVSKRRDSLGEVIAVALGQTAATGRTVVPASRVVIEGVAPTANGFMTADSDGGDGSARLFDIDGRLQRRIPIPPISTITALAADRAKPGPIIIGYYNYTTPNKWLRYDPISNVVSPTGIETKAPGDFSNIVAERVFVDSLDGKAKIPLEIVRSKDVRLDGSAPVILTAYGAYGDISRPYFDPTSLAWLERGGISAQAMIRGGGEYGDSWYEAARLKTKTVSSDDVAACAQWLAAHHYTSTQHTGITGASAGGFLMGLALTRNPSLYRAVVSDVGFYDLLRTELTPNGAFNVPEFGTVKDPEQFAWMVKQSPYENVVKGRAYPAVLMTTGENDPRVDPWESRKMIARLQAASTSGYPILLIQKSGQGHLLSSFDQQIEDATNTMTFFDSQLR